MSDVSTPVIQNRRSSDRLTLPAVVQALAGLSVIGAGVALKLTSNASDTMIYILFVTGGLLVPGNQIASAIRAWRGNGSPR